MFIFGSLVLFACWLCSAFIHHLFSHPRTLFFYLQNMNMISFGIVFFSFHCASRDNNFWIRFNTNLKRKAKTGKWKGVWKSVARILRKFFFLFQLPFGATWIIFFQSVFIFFVGCTALRFFSCSFDAWNKIQYSNLYVIFHKCAYSIEPNCSHSNRKLISFFIHKVLFSMNVWILRGSCVFSSSL